MSEAVRSYPSDPARTGLQLFRQWFGRRFARSTKLGDATESDYVLRAEITVARQWKLACTVVDALSFESTVEFEAKRAAVEKRLDDAGLQMALWVPREAELAGQEPGLSALAVALEGADALDDGRLELRMPVTLRLRRTGSEGSVVTAAGGLSSLWAEFTNRVPGSFQLDSRALFRLPIDEDERTELIDRIVNVAAQPDIDEWVEIGAEQAWTANLLEASGASVLGSPKPEDDEQSAGLRRHLRKALKAAQEQQNSGADGTALALLGSATYASEEKLSWALRGMDPSLYAGYDIVTVIADGVVRPVMEPAPGVLPWDVQPPG